MSHYDTSYYIDFDQWMLRVDEVTLQRTGLSVYDLPDLAFRDGYDAGDTPEQFFDEVVREELPESFDAEDQ